MLNEITAGNLESVRKQKSPKLVVTTPRGRMKLRRMPNMPKVRRKRANGKKRQSV